MYAKALFHAAMGFLLGGIPFAYLLTRWLAGVDILRRSEDGNPGTANAFVYGGPLVGLLSLLCDLGKGYLPVMLGMRLLPPENKLVPLVMLAPVLGHAFSPVLLRMARNEGIILRRTGGKCIATGFGALLSLIPATYIALVPAVFYLLLLVLPVHPNERKTIWAFGLSAVAALVVSMPDTVRIGCMAIFALTIWRNWRDAHAPAAGSGRTCG